MFSPQASVRPDPWNTKKSGLVASALVVMLPLTILGEGVVRDSGNQSGEDRIRSRRVVVIAGLVSEISLTGRL